MGVFSRLSDIINSNLVHMLDKAENPEKMVRLIIQEMEDTLVEVKSAAAKSIADKKTLERQRDQVQENIVNWQQKAELAVSKGRDDLAKLALEEKTKKAEVVGLINKDMDVFETAINKYRTDIGTLEDKLIEAKQRQKAILTRRNTATQQLKVRSQLQKHRAIDAAQKFEHFERGLDRLEGEVEAYDLKKQAGSLDDEFSKLQHETQVEKELAAIKQKMAGGEVKN